MFDPKLDVGNEGQVAEGHTPDANQPPRDTYQDFTTNAGVSTVHARNGWTVQSQLNVVGVSHREKALRFPQEGPDAPRVDLADYRVDVEKGGVRASLGHVTWGENRHLIKGFGSRGATMSVRLGRRADLTAAWLSGSSIVGWSNFLGVDRRQHRLGGASLGLEAFPARPGLLRLEATALTGSLLPISGFSQGVVNDAETSRGWACASWRPRRASAGSRPDTAGAGSTIPGTRSSIRAPRSSRCARPPGRPGISRRATT